MLVGALVSVFWVSVAVIGALGGIAFALGVGRA